MLRIRQNGSRVILRRLLRCTPSRGRESSDVACALQPTQADALPF